MTDETSFENMKAAYHTLGCKLNFAETSTIGKLLAERGVTTAREGERPDICVVNTCTVTELANKKCRQEIRRLSKLYPNATMVVTGCYAQLNAPEVAALDGVAIVAGNDPLACRTPKSSRSIAFERDETFRPIVFARRPHAVFLESAGWVRLLLQLLHDSASAWQKPERKHRAACGASAGCSGGRRSGDCRDRREYRRFWEKYRRAAHRPAAYARSSRRHRTLPHIVG